MGAEVEEGCLRCLAAQWLESEELLTFSHASRCPQAHHERQRTMAIKDYVCTRRAFWHTYSLPHDQSSHWLSAQIEKLQNAG